MTPPADGVNGPQKISHHNLHTTVVVKQVCTELAHGRVGERCIGVGQRTLYEIPVLGPFGPTYLATISTITLAPVF